MGAIHHSQGVLLQILSVFTLQSLLYPSCTKPHFSLALSYVFFLCWCIHLSPRALQGMITLSSVLRFLQCVPPPTLSHFLSFPIDGCCSSPSPSFLHHPLALSLPFCSLCARSLSWALTSHYDPSCGDFGTQYSLLGRSQCRGYKYELQTFSL